jgi:hypothetical protein
MQRADKAMFMPAYVAAFEATSIATEAREIVALLGNAPSPGTPQAAEAA